MEISSWVIITYVVSVIIGLIGVGRGIYNYYFAWSQWKVDNNDPSIIWWMLVISIIPVVNTICVATFLIIWSLEVSTWYR